MKTLLFNCQTELGIRNILIKDDQISYIGLGKSEYDEKIDCHGFTLFPGMIDTHVHVRDLEMTYKETWETATRAAIAGGITTIMDMPNTKPATIDLEGLRAKRLAALQALVNYCFHLGATENNLTDIEKILRKQPADVAGIKVYLSSSSSNEVVRNPKILEKIFLIAYKYDKPVLVHTEQQSILDKWFSHTSEKSIKFHSLIRNREAAIEGTKLVLDLADKVGSKLYLCHVSTQEEIELIKTAKKQNENVFCEVTPHHLFLNENIIPEVGNIGKVNPPLSKKIDNKALFKELLNGTIDTIGTDHAPHLKKEKEQSYLNAPSGFPGLETALPILFTKLREVISQDETLHIISTLFSKNPADIFKIEKRGEIKTGNYADLVLFDPNKKWKIKSQNFQSKAKYSPFEGMEVQGKVVMCFVNGIKYENQGDTKL